jgi:two-component system cell cycle sensor histidine kinase/response regulator CckA
MASGPRPEPKKKSPASRSNRDLQRRLDALLEKSPRAIAILDADGRIEDINPAFEALWFRRRADVEGHILREVLPPGADAITAELESAVRHRRALGGREFIVTLGSADIMVPGIPVMRAIEVIVSVVGEGNPGDFFIVEFADCTEVRLREERARQSQRLEVIGRVAAAIAHDFKNALSAISGFNELAMAELPTDSVVREDLKQIQFATSRATALCRQMLVFSRPRGLASKVVNLNRIFTGFDRLLRRVLGDRIQVTMRLDPDLWPVMAEIGQLERVVMNLGINARDAMPNGGRLVIETRNVDPHHDEAHHGHLAGPHVLLTVSDSGAGMDAATRARAFEPFFTTKTESANAALDDEDEGTGLGLSTVFDIVRQAGGLVSINSEVGHGTTVTISLPRAQVEPDANIARPTNGDSAVGEGPRSTAETRRVRRSETLLVVDDDDAVALAAQRILEAHGYTVLSATSSSRALEIAPHHHIDLALIDLVMPDGDGPRLAEALRQVHPQMHILFMSGYETTGSLERASVARETDLIEKPFSSATLLAQVGLALAGT